MVKKSKGSSNVPDGGWGWVVVLGGMFVYTIVFGSLRCQSVLFVPIVNEFQSDFSAVAWVSSIATAGFSFAGVLAAPLIAKITHRWTVILGGFVAAIGTLLAAFAPSLAVLDLTAGLLAGIGMGIAFLPSPVIIGHYFTKRRSLAINIASVGSSIGTLAICPINQVMIEALGIRGYFFVFSGVFLNICVCGALMRPIEVSLDSPAPASDRVEEIKPEENADREVQELTDQATSPNTPQIAENDFESESVKILSADTDIKPSSKENKPEETKKMNGACCKSFRNSPLLSCRPYHIYCVSQVIFLAGFLCNQLYIVPYAEIEVGIPKIQASFLMSIGAFVEIVSRILFGFLGDVKRINRIWLFTIVLFALSFWASIFPLMKSFGSLAAISALTGLFQGGFSGMSVVILADIVGMRHYATALGISTLLNGVGTLLTPPAVGWAVDQTGTPSTALFISAGILFLGAVLSAFIKVRMNYEKQHSAKSESRPQDSLMSRS